LNILKFDVLVMVTVLWDIALCNVVGVNLCFGGMYSLNLQVSKTLAGFC